LQVIEHGCFLDQCGRLYVKKEIFILTTEPPEVLGRMETFICQQILGFEERGYTVGVFHRYNSGQASFLHLAQRVSRPLADGSSVGDRQGSPARNPRKSRCGDFTRLGWRYPLRVPPGCKQIPQERLHA
jgi:hypothetical protein